jgi:hypothetical protein
VRHEAAFLHHVADVAPELNLVDLPNIRVVHGDRAAVRLHEAVEAPQQGGLARPALADERHAFAVRHVDRNAGECVDRAGRRRVPLHDISRDE